MFVAMESMLALTTADAPILSDHRVSGKRPIAFWAASHGDQSTILLVSQLTIYVTGYLGFLIGNALTSCGFRRK